MNSYRIRRTPAEWPDLPIEDVAVFGTLGTILATTLIGAGTQLAGAKMASSAAKSAAKTQSDAATRAAELDAQARREALQLQREQYARAQANAQPFIDIGRGATSTLGALMGLGPMTTASGGSPMAPTLPATPAPTGSRMQPRTASPYGTAMPRGGETANLGARVPLGTIGRRPIPTASLAGDMVTLRAPTGATRQFARESPEHRFYLTQGAIEV